jgi:hypothetical protein
MHAVLDAVELTAAAADAAPLLLLLHSQSNPSLYVMWPDGCCAAMGLQGMRIQFCFTMLNPSCVLCVGTRLK